jgi:hypothetical protein
MYCIIPREEHLVMKVVKTSVEIYKRLYSHLFSYSSPYKPYTFIVLENRSTISLYFTVQF